MRHLSKLVVGTLSLAVMLVGFVPSLARAQMAIVERIDVPNNCFELFGEGFLSLRPSQRRRRGRKKGPKAPSPRRLNGGDVRLEDCRSDPQISMAGNVRKGARGDVKGPYVLEPDGEEFQDAGKTYRRIYGKTTHVVPFPNINARTTGLLTWKIDGVKNKDEWEADFNHLQGYTQITGSEAIVVKIIVSLTRNGGALGDCRSEYVPVASDPTMYLLCEEDCFYRSRLGTVDYYECLWMCSEFFPFPNPSPITLEGVSSQLP